MKVNKDTPFVDITSDVKTEEDKYKIICSQKLETTAGVVNAFIRDGYECQGGISVTCWRDVNGIEFCYCQAMIRKE